MSVHAERARPWSESHCLGDWRAIIPIMVVRCPICRRQTIWEENPWHPFCSERCRLIDLGAWIEERYRIPDPDAEPDEESPADPADSEHGAEPSEPA